jgi:hypothetical protein
MYTSISTTRVICLVSILYSWSDTMRRMYYLTSYMSAALIKHDAPYVLFDYVAHYMSVALVRRNELYVLDDFLHVGCYLPTCLPTFQPTYLLAASVTFMPQFYFAYKSDFHSQSYFSLQSDFHAPVLLRLLV